MSLQLEKVSKLKRVYSLSIKKEDLEKIIDKETSKLLPKIKLDGYRKGKVPAEMVKEKHIKKLIYDAFTQILETELAREVKEKDIKIVTQPHVDDLDINLSEVSDIKASVVFEVEPTIPKIDYQKIEAEYPELKMTSAEVEKEVNIVAESSAKEEEIKNNGQEIKKGYITDIDFEGLLDGVPFKNGAGKGYKLDVGSNTFIPGFEDQLIGHKKGDEFDVNVSFPKDYHAKDMAGKEVVFKVKINAIFEKKVPKVDDHFAKTLKLKDVSELQEKIKSEIGAAYKDSFIDLVRGKLIDVILEKNAFDVPDTLVQKEVKSRMEEEKKSPESNGKATKTEKELTSEITKSFMIWYFIDNIANVNNLTVTEKEIEDFISRVAFSEKMGDPTLLFQIYNSNPKLKSSLRQKIMENKVINFLLENISKKSINLSKEEFAQYLKSLEKTKGESWKIKRKGFFSG